MGKTKKIVVEVELEKYFHKKEDEISGKRRTITNSQGISSLELTGDPLSDMGIMFPSKISATELVGDPAVDAAIIKNAPRVTNPEYEKEVYPNIQNIFKGVDGEESVKRQGGNPFQFGKT